MKKIKVSSLLMIISVGLVWATTADAVPSFARNTGKNCSYCHNAWPQLNDKGRIYKELGYRLPDDPLKAFKDIAEENSVGVSALLFARPYDETYRESNKNSDTKLRALHEAEVIVAGRAGENWSGFFELEAEDEDTNARGLEIGVSSATLSYNYSAALNVHMTYGSMMFSDPYGFIGDHLRMTRGHVGFIDKSFGGADGSLRSTRQNIDISGRPSSNLFYSAGVSGEAGDAEGVEAGTIHARIAFDATKDIMVGAFIIDGTVEPVAASSSTTFAVCTGGGAPVASCTAAGDVYAVTTTTGAVDTREYQRVGIDAQADFGGSRLQFALVMGTDDTTTPGVEVDNDNMSIQAYHVYKTTTGQPTWVPLIRFDTYESSNGTVSTDEITLNVTRYFEQNIKGYIEYWTRSAQVSTNDQERLTVQLAVGF